jgi:SAM-dependent methyltransferase
MAHDEYLMAGQASELERLRLQAQVWEPAGRELLTQLGPGSGQRVADIGCGALGWLRLLAEWVGPSGHVIGTDIDPALLAAAADFVTDAELVKDDLFASQLKPRSCDLVHARFLIAPLGRATELLEAFRMLVAPGGLLILEEPDTGSWHFNPPAPAAQLLIELTLRSFADAGANFDAGRGLPGLLTEAGLEPSMRAVVYALPPGHPYLKVPIQFSVSLEPRLTKLVSLDELRELRAKAEAELSDPRRWGTTFTLVQTWTRIP